MAPPVTLLPLTQQQQGGAQLVESSLARTQRATYAVEVAWGAAASNAFRLDHSTLDGTDVLTDPFSVTFDGANDDLTAEAGHGVKSVRIRRGREDQLARMSAGEATVVLHDPDGLYNPRNEASALYGQLLPMRQLRIRADSEPSGTMDPRPLFRGFIRSIEHDPHPDVRETTIVAVDLFLVLSRTEPSVSIAGATTTGDAIGVLLDEIQWTDADLRMLDTGDTFTGFDVDGSTALSGIEGLLEAERGQFYIDSAGAATFDERHTRPTRAAAGTIADTMQAIRPGVDIDQVRNRARVTRQIGSVTGTPQTAADGNSIATYGPADVGDITSPYLDTDGQAASLAGYLVGLLSTPRSPVWGLELINRDAATLTQILERDLGDRITVTDSRGSTSGDYFIEQTEHMIADGGLIHRCTWTLSERGQQVFVVGQSTVGGADAISY